MDKGSLAKREAFLTKTLQDLEATVRKLSANNSSGFLDQFQQIEYTQQAARIPAKVSEDNKRYNRYNNILAYDHSRVRVQPQKFNENSDYVNANMIKGPEGKTDMYIASQAPVPDGFAAFWQMIWEHKANIIVMLTNEVEGGKLKCHRYWPDQYHEVMQLGPFTVSFSFQEVHPTFVRRVFQLSSGKEARDITQFAFTAWPDHGVPATTQELLEFRTEVRKEWSPRKGKLVVHCSAGVGRTGTFIGLDRFLEGVAAGRAELVLDIVKSMRCDRNFMVQSLVQYIYLHHVCLDGAHYSLMDTQRALRFEALSEQERNDEEVGEIEAQVDAVEQQLDFQIEQGEDALEEEYRKNPKGFSGPLAPREGSMRRPKGSTEQWQQAIEEAGSAPRFQVDASASVGKYTDDLHKAARIPASLRKSSLLEISGLESEFWRTRKNVPVSLEDKGYILPNARSLTKRLESLAKQQQAWRDRYDEAERSWAKLQLKGGELYDARRQLTALESRLESLAAAEEAWLYRGDGFRSAREEDVRRTLARLTQRLQSLQSTLLNSEARWRARGDGMRQKQVIQEGTRVHTTGRLGGLMERLEMLQQEEQAWLKRDYTKRFDRTQFEREVQEEQEKQERAWAAQLAAQEQQRADEEARAAAARRAEEERLAKMTDEQREAARRESIKEKMVAASVLPESYDPGRERALKQKQKEDELRAKAEAAAAEEAAKKAKEAAEQAKKQEIEDAKKKASRFLGKLKI